MSNQKSNIEGVARKLKRLRLKMGLTQIEIAEKVGMSQAAYFRLESGERSFSIEALILFSDFFDVSPNYFLGIEEDKQLKNTIVLPDYLLDRVKYEANKKRQSLENEVIETLEKVYPAENPNLNKIINLFYTLDSIEKKYIIDLLLYLTGKIQKRPSINDMKKQEGNIN